MALTLTTIKSYGATAEIDIDDYDDWGIMLKQEDDLIALTKKQVQELGLFLTNLDLD